MTEKLCGFYGLDTGNSSKLKWLKNLYREHLEIEMAEKLYREHLEIKMAEKLYREHLEIKMA